MTRETAAGTVSGHALVERERELGVLERQIDAAKGGSGSVVTIEGPAGIGKTSLVRAAGELARRAGLAPAVARAALTEAHLPHGVVCQLFEPLLRRTGSAVRRELLAGAGEPAASLLSGRADPPNDPPAPRPPGAMTHALYRLGGDLAAATPLLLCVDDAHFCDGPSLRFVAYLVRRIENLPVLVVLAAQPGEGPEDDELFLDVFTGPAVEVLEPRPLTAAGVASLLEAGLHVTPDPAFARACHRATGGNPFLAHELIAALDAERIEPLASAVYRIAGLGPKVRARAVTLRLARLPGRSLDLARAVAVLGDGAPTHLAAGLAGLDLSVALQAADLLRAAGILEPRSTMSADQGLSFVHPLVRSALETGTAGASQRAAHARAARLLAAQSAEPARIAGHLMRTDPQGDRGRIPLLREAARQALRQGSSATAVAYLRRALAEEPADPDALLLVDLGAAEAMSGMPEATSTLSRAVEIAVSSDDLAAAAREHARTLMVSGDVQGALAARAKAIARLGERPELLEIFEVEQLISSNATGSIRTKLLAHLARLPARGQDLTPAERLTLAVAAIEEVMAGDSAERAADFAVRALGDGALLGLVGPGDPALYAATTSLSLAGRSQRARHELTQALGSAEELGSAVGIAFASTLRALCAWHSGSLTDAETDARRALELPISDRQWGLLRPIAVATLADLLLERGRTDEAETVILENHGGPRAEQSVLWDLVLVARGRVHSSRRRYSDALADFELAGRRQRAWGATTSGITTWAPHCVSALIHLGRRGDAKAVAAEELVRSRRLGAPRQVGIALSCSARTAPDEDAVDLLRQAVAVLAPSEARLDHARALVDLGAALRRAGRRSAAQRYLHEGLGAAQTCGADALVLRARDELAASGGTLGRSAVSGTDALTPSERRVAAMAAQGLTNREIARSLLISVSTVEHHLSHSYRKLGVASRRKLAPALATVVPAGPS